MRKTVDITGIIKEGMWNYEPPFPKIKIKPLPRVPWVKSRVYCEIFEGMHSQTGTYLETPAHYFGNDKSYLLIDIPVEKLINIDCVVLNLMDNHTKDDMGRISITVKDLESCEAAASIAEGGAILVATGWDKYWMEDKYLKKSPYFTYEAMRWLIEKKPFLMGSDFARWDNINKSENFFSEFYNADILMMGPCVDLVNIEKPKVKLTVLPLKIDGTSSAPCRAVIME
ncbi:MAG: cyclase family protein [Clostridiales bacterium]|nr:cyclase family protein [Clostridiales bacterium]